jgi:L-histidine N-alpha-methyltransferase
MSINESSIEVSNYLQESYRTGITKDVIRGFTAAQKFIPSKYFYDFRGSRLFEDICDLPEPSSTMSPLICKW